MHELCVEKLTAPRRHGCDSSSRQYADPSRSTGSEIKMSDTKRPDQDDVEGHGLRGYNWSDERLKQAISSLETALGGLRAVGKTPS